MTQLPSIRFILVSNTSNYSAIGLDQRRLEINAVLDAESDYYILKVYKFNDTIRSIRVLSVLDNFQGYRFYEI